jgi:hypothetical protein
MNQIALITFALLIIAVVTLAWVQRSANLSRVFPWLVGAGMAGALLSALYAFMNATTPIEPYETGSGAWAPLYWGFLLFALAGFGLGVMLVSLFALPIAYFISRRKVR